MGLRLLLEVDITLHHLTDLLVHLNLVTVL